MRALQRGKVHLKVQREKTNIRQTREHSLTFLKGHPRPLFVYFWSFIKQTLQILQQINVKNVHPVDGAVIRTHGLLSLLP